MKRPHTNLAILIGAAILVPLVVGGSFGCPTEAECPQGTSRTEGRCVLPLPEDAFTPEPSTGPDAAGGDAAGTDTQIQDTGADSGAQDAGDVGDGDAKADAGDQEDAKDTEAPSAADNASMGDSTNDVGAGSAEGAPASNRNANAALLARMSEGAARENERLAAHCAEAKGRSGGHGPSPRGRLASTAAARRLSMHMDHGHVRHSPDVEGPPRQVAAEDPVEPGRAPCIATRGVSQEPGPLVG